MATRQGSHHDANDSSQTTERSAATQTKAVPAAGLLDLLGDEYTRSVLRALVERPRTGSEVVEAADVSKATAYRRLDELQEAGLVETTTQIDRDGHHCKLFHAVVGRLAVEFGADGYDATLRVTPEESSRGEPSATSDGYAEADD